MTMTTDAVEAGSIEQYIRVLWDRQGTDLHIAPGSPMRIRVEGALEVLDGAPVLNGREASELIMGILPPAMRSQLEIEKELDFSFSWHDQARFRGNAFHQQGALAMALRMIPYRIPTFEELGLPPVIEHFANLPQGLVLVTGPTGSGKSTTLASMIDYINEQPRVPHPHDRGPDRVRAPAQASAREPARGRHRHRLVRTARCAPRSVRTPTSSSSVRCVTPRRSSSR